MSTTAGSTRALSIKTGVVNRLVKEVQSYKDEAGKLQQKTQEMESSGTADEYDLRQQKRVHADSLQMIPDSEKRLAKAVEELEDLIDAGEDSLAGTEELEKAKTALKSAQSTS